jgi:adenosine 3'-phospho 5'-phosphosulfate transporter B3
MTEVESSPSASAVKTPWFETQTPSIQFSLLACGVFLFFGLHNLLQEAMMNIEGFKFGVMLGYMEVLG